MNPSETSARSQQAESQENTLSLLEGITLASNELELLRMLPPIPFLNNTWLSQHQDIVLFHSYLSSVIVPTSSVLKIGLDIHRALKIAAYQLDPFVLKNRIAYFSPSHSTAAFATTQTTHCGVVVLGITAVGKTYTLNAVLSTIPQTIERKGYPGMSKVIQITWIRIDISRIASIEALAEQIIRTIDDALAANGTVFDDTIAGVRSATAKMERAIRLMRTHYVTLLVVDEIQAENFAKPKSADLRFWFMSIANQKIALIFSGNPLGFEFHSQKNETDEIRYPTQQLRRLVASNRTRIDPAETVEDPDWGKLIRTLACCHLDGYRDPINMELERLKHIRTGGFPDFYVALHCELEKLRLANPNCTVDETLIDRAAKASSLIQEMQPLITAFTTRDAIALRKCTDVDHDYYQNKWRESSSSSSEPPITEVSISPPPSAIAEADPAKSIETDRKKIENRRNKERTIESRPVSSIKAEVLEYQLDQLDILIKGRQPANAAR